MEDDEASYDQKLRVTPRFLREMVLTWQQYDTKTFRESSLWGHVQRYWKSKPTWLEVIPSGPYAGHPCGGHEFSSYPEVNPYKEALRFFVLFLLNPEWEKLAGPCARCGKYYIKKRASQNVYCSRRCGNAATAAAALRVQREKDHTDKLHRAAEAAQKWTTAKTKLDWKRFVSRSEPDITPKFLTRAVNEGEFTEPQKGR